ncbi:serine/threonine phosphatase [Anabaena cylindrica FACHB-243]|uniref:Protein serine/threonine phosphatase n=1 Tax=Anabaena cylindrica (strain ATCC 27899 / PCC 7122) TaxID=272123 RepID=K9ZCJ6_ANACC|nr:MULTISPECIES: serine/threonine phosphatase [Anabaena]AFZ56943.1 protein serine/threonine phosphatase [Anabaena cylindrica PCC 7122]MBD2418853.1 serine/threonine phosphatase [Anabaena cylindrica FACHB-243]MBY5285777.1 serine/threonine phosphatase [Anabaena sp. CCAP 1446/1C]MBY5308744.1 serine/threonine phosphatase [Anabaena sp. CCAP 1446/1C]MCM2405133.1 serine/threonine phosphatase [Anabaena sp. CCAP 1446/1C]
MLICPHCEFENPNDNKFCQKCGTSLIHRTCHQCSADVLLDMQYCQNCGAECGTIWWAIITQETSVAVSEVEDGKLTQHQGSTSSQPQFAVGSFLDRGQRYQLLEPLPSPEVFAANTEVKVRVLDCQPYQISPIEAVLDNGPQGLIVPSVSVIGIPPLAQAYVTLQPDRPPGIPLIHDAWQQDNIQVVLIEDRSHWQLLIDAWQDQETNPLQILHWCYQMIQLWGILERVNCRQSLLELSNLRLDEDQTLGLQRLYLEIPGGNLSPDEEESLTIKALGRVWHAICRESQRTQLGSAMQILEDLEVGKIETLEELRSRLQDIATELEPPSPADFSSTATNNTTSPTMLQDNYREDIDKNEDAPTMILSMQLKSVENTGRTDVGRQRNHNEDYFGIETSQQKLELPRSRILQARGIYILCDGMGGHASGEVASELAVKTVRQYLRQNWVSEELPTAETIQAAVFLANQTIYNLNQQDARSGVGRMGTTLVMLLMQNTKLAVAHVGDSRLYRVTRKRGLEQLTVDHEVGQREIAKGVDFTIAYARPDAYQLTQALGPRDTNFLHPHVDFFEIREDTLLLLASDGLSDNDLLENHWQTHLEPLLSSGVNLELGLNDLIDLANEHNGHDNITGILIRVKVCPNQQNFP